MDFKILLPVLIVFLLACGALGAQPTAGVPPPVPPASPSNTVVFRDDFEGNLGPGWQWLREDPSNWSLTQVFGSLQINAGSGHVNSEGNSNLLLRSIPLGDFRIETSLFFLPVANFQFAGLIVYESSQNFIQAGRAFCTGSEDCVGDGYYMDLYLGGVFVPPNFASAFTDAVPVYLRITSRGNTYVFESGADGIGWDFRGTVTSDINPVQIGLVAGQSTAGMVPAVFDYFEATSLP